MTRARAFVAAVPQRVWTAVAGLALLASLAVAAVIGAGLSVWRSAVGSTAQPPVAAVEPPGSGLVILPGGHAPQVPSRFTHPPAVRSVPATAVPATGGPVTPAVTTPLGPAPATPATSVAFTPQLLAAGGGPAGDEGHATGLLAARIEELVGGHTDAHAAAVAHAAHLRHEAIVAHRQATRHHAKHAKAGDRHAAKHHARHAAARD